MAILARQLTEDNNAFTFEDVLSINPPIDFVQGLKTPLPAINLLVLSLLEQGCTTSIGRNYVASKPELSLELIRAWLQTPDVGVSNKCEALLSALLSLEASLKRYAAMDPRAADEDTVDRSEEDLMWRRIVTDRDVYGLIYSTCGRPVAEASSAGNERQRSIAQTRLLELLDMAVGVPYVWRSCFSDIEQTYGVEKGGLMQFAALHMVDYENDELIRYIIIKFLTNMIIRGPERSIAAQDATAFKFLIASGLHERTVREFIEGDLTHDAKLYCHFIAVWAGRCPAHFLKTGVEMQEKILRRVLEMASRITRNRLNNDLNIFELDLLDALPRPFLLNTPELVTPLRFAVLHPATVDVFELLARSFCGYDPSEIAVEDGVNDLPPVLVSAEQAAARALYFLYHAAQPELWVFVAGAALSPDISLATAALRFLEVFLSARWRVLPRDASHQPSVATLPSESQLQGHCRGFLGDFSESASSLPVTAFAVVCGPAARTSVFSVLLRSSRTVRPRTDRAGDVPRAQLGALLAFREELTKALRLGLSLPAGVDRALLGRVEELVLEGEGLGFGKAQWTMPMRRNMNGTH